MNIGLTYDLRSAWLAMGYTEEETAEFDRESTIDAIDSTLQELGYKTQRIGHLMQLIDHLQKGERWDLVFNICEGMHGPSREAQVPALLEAFRIPAVFSSSLVMAVTLEKSITKRIVRDAGINTPGFFVVCRPEDIVNPGNLYPLFAKPLSEGTGKGINAASVISNFEELRNTCLYLLAEFRQPVLVESFLCGREFTVGITGTGKDAKAIGTMEIVLKPEAEKEVYSYTNKEECESLVTYLRAQGREKEECEKLALDAYRILGCEDAARVDIRYDAAGIPSFIEINPLPGLHPEHSDLPILAAMNGISYRELMKMIMDSAVKKITTMKGNRS